MTTEGMSASFGSAELTGQAEALLGTLETQATSTTETSPQVETPAAPAASVINDDAVVTVKIDGQEQQVPLKELKNGYSRESVFTQRMQNMAKQKSQLEQYFAEQQAQIFQQQQAIQLAREELQRSNPLQQLLQMQQQQAPSKNPNEIATLGELQAAQQQLLQQLHQVRTQDQQAFQQALAQARQEVEQNFEVRRDQARFTDELTRTLQSEDGKMLAELSPQAESIIRFETMKMGPESVDEAIVFMKKFVDEWSTKVKGRVQTTSAVAKARTVMEPPAGSPAPTIQQPKVQIMNKDGSVNYDNLRAKALSLLD